MHVQNSVSSRWGSLLVLLKCKQKSILLMARLADTRNRKLEKQFRRILKYCVEQSTTPITLNYITPGEHSKRREAFSSLHVDTGSDAVRQTLDFQVLTPIFYSRFFHYATPAKAFATEILDPEIRCRTATTTNVESLTNLFDTLSAGTSRPKHGLLARLRWALTLSIRPRPLELNYARQTEVKTFFGASEMDKFIQTHNSRAEVERYRRSIFNLFLGERIGSDWEVFGLSRDGVLKIYDAILQTMLLCFAGFMAASIVEQRKLTPDLPLRIAVVCLPFLWWLLKRAL